MADLETVDPVEREKLRGKLIVISGRMESEARRRVGLRAALEQEWLLDAAQYHGRYDEKIQANLDKSQAKSKLFINMTRPKTDAMSARLMDLLFPTDDKNWGIQPTPVPSLTKDAEAASAASIELQEQLKEAEEPQEDGTPAQPDPALRAQADEAEKKADELQGVLEESKARCELMSAEIDDQLKESLYHAVKRDQIEDACRYGTGVTKGPVTGDKVRKGWQKRKAPGTNPDGTPQVDANGQPVMVEGDGYELQMSDGDRPSMRHVNLWGFFPDPDVSKVEDGQGNFERHLLNTKRVQCLQHLKGFDKDAIRRLLKQKPRDNLPSYMVSLRDITGSKQQGTGDLYHVWEYSGPLSAEDMRDLALAMGDTETANEIGDPDPLAELNAVVWFCDGEILKFSIYPYDSGECMYSVFNLVKDEASVFGYGIPAIMRHTQRALNAAWRQMMDNAGLAVGPQIIMRKGMVEPENGEWVIGGGTKVWLANELMTDVRQAFGTFDIPIRQAEIANIIALAKQFMDDETAMPMIAQGEQGTGVTKTAQGMALLMNSANVVFRRIVKNFDDDVTTPDIRRFYDWNMQFSTKPEIKGDYEVDARGSTVLLVREMQSQNLMMIATNLGGHPQYGHMLNNREVLRKMVQTMGIPSRDVVLKDNEIDAILANAAANDTAAQVEKAKAELAAKQMEFEQEKLDAQVQMANQDAANKKYIAELQRDTQLIMLAEKLNVTLDQMDAKLLIVDKQTASDERKLAAEIAVEDRNAEKARAAGQQPTGSGGTISAGTVAA